ncbi:PHP domain-containing protein [Chloroflexia bacterium SDU3-3]|nr:PHP domain-containing protein [Chloroflexia bacterium SDU3-3]
MFDLHIHTNATPHHSTWQPAALVAAAQAAGLTTIAAADHNTVASVRALLDAGAAQGLRVIAGVEIDSGFGGKLWHTLVYGVAPEAPELLALCDAVFSRNHADALALRAHLDAHGFRLGGLDAIDRPINVADVGTALARENALPGRDAAESDEAAGMRYILTELAGAYRPLGVDEIIAVAHPLGGTVVLAHPGRSKGIYAIPATEHDIAAMADAGLDGIEVYYPTHTPTQQQIYGQLAQRYGLLVTGGSDSHGPHDPLARWDDQLGAAFLRRLA